MDNNWNTFSLFEYDDDPEKQQRAKKCTALLEAAVETVIPQISGKEFAEAVKKVMDAYEDVGASDTEPREIFFCTIEEKMQEWCGQFDNWF